DHRQGLAGQRPVLPAVLVGEAQIEDGAQEAAVEPVEIEKMARQRRQSPLGAGDPGHAGHAPATLSMMPTASPISASLTTSGGRMRSTFSPAVSASSPFSRSRATKSAAGTTQRMPSNRPAPRSSAKSFG